MDGNPGLCGWSIKKECPGDPPLPMTATLNATESKFQTIKRCHPCHYVKHAMEIISLQVLLGLQDPCPRLNILSLPYYPITQGRAYFRNHRKNVLLQQANCFSTELLFNSSSVTNLGQTLIEESLSANRRLFSN